MDMREINRGVIAEFRANDGRLSGPMEGAPIVLLTTIGHRSGAPHTTPVGFVDVGGQHAAAAANGGAETNPDWYLNIEHNNQVILEVNGSSIPATATITTGSQRATLLAQLTENLPGMRDHVAATSRDIPVVLFDEAS